MEVACLMEQPLGLLGILQTTRFIRNALPFPARQFHFLRKAIARGTATIQHNMIRI